MPDNVSARKRKQQPQNPERTNKQREEVQAISGDLAPLIENSYESGKEVGRNLAAALSVGIRDGFAESFTTALGQCLGEVKTTLYALEAAADLEPIYCLPSAECPPDHGDADHPC